MNELTELFGVEPSSISRIGGHEGGRNVVFACRRDEIPRVLRVSYLTDRSLEDYLAETEFIYYLRENGAPVAGVLVSRNGKLVEALTRGGRTFYASLFERAPGDQLADHGYKYLDGVPLERYYFDCGAALGRIHELSKRFKPVHPRYDFFEKFNRERFNALIPDSLEPLRAALSELVDELRRTERTPENFGTVHFDFSDGNYMIDYSTGKITAFDFDNACRCWYMYDLANLWAHGVGWIQWEPDAEKRRAFMDAYFAEIVRGYRSETAVADAELARLPLFLRAEQMENIVDEFEIAHNAGEEAEIDETMAYNIKCVTEKLPFNGFFDDIFSPDSPFELEETSDER